MKNLKFCVRGVCVSFQNEKINTTLLGLLEKCSFIKIIEIEEIRTAEIVVVNDINEITGDPRKSFILLSEEDPGNKLPKGAMWASTKKPAKIFEHIAQLMPARK